MAGSKAALMHAAPQKKTGAAVLPTFIQPWLPEQYFPRTKKIVKLRLALPPKLIERKAA